MYYVFSIVSLLLTIGLSVTYRPALALCKVESINVCVISEMILTMPSWIGTFCGVLVSATLAYNYNLKKQRSDDNKKRWLEEIANANKSIMLLNKCYGDLGALKTAFVNHTNGSMSITRAMSCPHLVGRGYDSVDFDPTTIYFLLRKGIVEPTSPRNPNYIFNTIERYNVVVAMFNKRNDLALEISEKYREVNLNNINGHRVRLGFDFIKDEIGLSNFINYLTLTELLFQNLDKSIKDLSLLSHELPQIFDHYFNNAKYREKSFQYEIATFDPLLNPSYEIQQPFVELDIDAEISQLISSMKSTGVINWRPDGWLVTPFSY